MSDVKIFANVIEDEALEQINLLTSQKAFANQKIRIMPDVHAGKGCVIGFTAVLNEYVIPNIVGVDIGCGMRVVNLGNIDLNLNNLDQAIREYVPAGRSVHEGRIMIFNELQSLKCYRDLKDAKRLERSIGTLGGGNHFIEIDEDSDKNKYLVIHTGSRNLGKQVADYYQNLAYELLTGKDELIAAQEKIIAEYKAEGRKHEIADELKKLRANFKARDCDIPKDLAYLSGKFKDNYLHDMRICQEYAVLNRRTIAEIILTKLGLNPDSEYFESVHNYIDLDRNIVRKGAIDASLGKDLIIPLNMRDGCILGTGKGNDDWNQSAPHGAGRLMSRTKARHTFTLDEYREVMKDVFTTSVSEATIDELPMAYKDKNDILSVISETVDIIDIIKPVYNFKASE